MLKHFKLFLDLNLVIVKKLFSVLSFKACKLKIKKGEENKKKTQ